MKNIWIRQSRLLRLSVTAALGIAVIYGAFATLRPTDEVVLNAIGEPYEQVRRQSHSTLPALSEWNFINLYVRRPAIFRFNDPVHGFATPAAKFLSIGAERNGAVYTAALSPQVETLPLDASMKILVDLQNQFRRGGWRPIRVSDNPPIEDTPATRAAIQRCSNPITYWQAEDKLQIVLDIRCFRRDGHPNEDRYLMTLQLAKPFVNDD
jgi:hypothetical protein